jgi:broad specificity phosphatase PhoE
LGKIGGDSGLTPAGKEYARRLAEFAKEHIATVTTTDPVTGEVRKQSRPARLWTSTLRRTKETSQFIEHNKIQHTWDNGDTGEWVQFRPQARRNLDELYAGTCDGMTYKEIEQVFPEEFARRQDDKLSYRYPRGESYMDVTLRLEPLAQEMERTREPVLIVGHQGILRILYAYFMGLDRKEAPYVSIPLNSVIELSPHAYGCHEKRFCLMRKEEMLNDGQDEPVTSMPIKRDDSGRIVSTGSTQAQYAHNDPVMNAPSC